MEDLVSIITPSYNSSRFIQNTIESILNQSYSNWELLITDDCSTDNSVSIIKRYLMKDDRIKLFIQEKNYGVGAARNRSLREAKGRYIAFLDSDDIWNNDKLEKQLAFIKKHRYAFIFSSYDLIDEDGNLLNKKIKVPDKISYSDYLKNTIIGCLTVVIDRSQTGYFEMPLIRTSQDMATWLLILRRGFWAYGMNESLAKYRLVNNSNSSKKLKAVMDVWKVYRKIENLSFTYSAYNFFCYISNAVIKRI